MDAKLSSYLWKSPRMLKTSCHLYRIGQFKVSCGTLESMLTFISKGKQSSWGNYLDWIGLSHVVSLIFLMTWLPWWNTFLQEVVGKIKVLRACKCLFLSLCVLTCEYIFDETSVFSTFLHYLYAYDDFHNLVKTTLYVGMNCLKGRNYMCLNALTLSLCISRAKSFEPNGILMDNSTLDDAFIFDSFLYYLFAFDDYHDSYGWPYMEVGYFLVGPHVWVTFLYVLHGL